MSLQFSRSMRSLKPESFRAARIGLILGSLNMLFVLGWFFLARVTLYEVSTQAQVNKDGLVKAVFSEEAVKRIKPGQAAIVRVSNGADQSPAAVSAIVVDAQANGRIELLIQSRDFFVYYDPAMKPEKVEVETEYITPANLVMRATGRYINQGQMPVSPQPVKDTNQQ